MNRTRTEALLLNAAARACQPADRPEPQPRTRHYIALAREAAASRTGEPA